MDILDIICKIIACVLLLLTPVSIRAIVKEYKEDIRKINTIRNFNNETDK